MDAERKEAWDKGYEAGWWAKRPEREEDEVYMEGWHEGMNDLRESARFLEVGRSWI